MTLSPDKNPKLGDCGPNDSQTVFEADAIEANGSDQLFHLLVPFLDLQRGWVTAKKKHGESSRATVSISMRFDIVENVAKGNTFPH